MTLPGTLTSLSNPRVKAAVRLRDRRERETTGLTIVDGARELARALDAGVEIQEAFVVAGGGAERRCPRRCRPPGSVGLTPVSEPVLAKIAFGDRSDGVVAIVRTPPTDLGRLVLGTQPLVVVIEAVEKPGNLGAILRTADGAGRRCRNRRGPRDRPVHPQRDLGEPRDSLHDAGRGGRVRGGPRSLG